MRPYIYLLTSRPWHEWIAGDSELLTIAKVKLFTDPKDFTPELLAAENPDYVFATHWSHIIPARLVETGKIVIFHMTDLPYGRGGSPLQNLIIRGHDTTKISAIQCVQEIDAGPIYLQKDLSLNGSAIEIFERSSTIMRDMIVEILQTRPIPKPQVGQVVKFKRRKPDESNLASLATEETRKFYDFIRMLDAPGYPKAYIDVSGFRIEFTNARLSENGVAGNFTIKRKDQA